MKKSVYTDSVALNVSAVNMYTCIQYFTWITSDQKEFLYNFTYTTIYKCIRNVLNNTQPETKWQNELTFVSSTSDTYL